MGMIQIRFGISHPGTIKGTVELAIEAEKAGWDGFFLWDHILGPYPEPVVPIPDPWILLGAMAAKTRKIKLGAHVTPLARRRPWKVARETVTLDHLSNGRLIFGVGLGNPPAAFIQFG